MHIIRNSLNMAWSSRRLRVGLAVVLFASLIIFGLSLAPGWSFRTRLSKPGTIAVVRHPAPAVFADRALAALPIRRPDSLRPLEVDLRGQNLTALDLARSGDGLRPAVFDDTTRWPKSLPVGFDPAATIERNCNPGLGVRTLHSRGITGKGIGVGVIDQPLLTSHVEYADRLRLYEEIHVDGEPNADMHGVGVASIAVGKRSGVAPGADLYFVACFYADPQVPLLRRRQEYDFSWLAQAVDRLLAVHRTLPAHQRLRVISISQGWSASDRGFAELQAAVTRAGREGIFVVSTSLPLTHRLALRGLGRDPQASPDDSAAQLPGASLMRDFLKSRGPRFPSKDTLFVPMDHRAIASPTGPHDYVSFPVGGLSWSVPWIAGLYALACQVCPEITPERFWSAALSSGRTIRLRRGQDDVDFGAIVDPVALIETLTRGANSSPGAETR